MPRYILGVLLGSVPASLLCLAVASLAAGGGQPAKRIPVRSGGVEALALLSDDAPGKALVPRRECTAPVESFTPPNVLVDCDFLEFPHNENAIAVDLGNPLRLLTGANGFEDFRKGNASVLRSFNLAQFSQNGGETWLNRYPALGEYSSASDPVFAFDTYGNGYAANIAYHSGQFGGSANGTVIVNRMDLRSTAWGPPVVVYRGFGGSGTSVFNDKEWMVVDTRDASAYRNNVYVTWTKFESGSGGAFLRSPIWFARSTDGGRTFEPAREISGSGAFCITQVTGPEGECDESHFSVSAVGPDGTLYVAFMNTNTAPPAYRSQYLVTKSGDGGLTWSDPVKVADLVDGVSDYPLNVDRRQTLSGVQFRVHAGGNIVAADDGKLYLVWADNRNGTASATNTDVFVSVSIDGGLNWSTPENVNAAADQFFPWAAWNPKTRQLQIVYLDRGYGPGTSGGKYGVTLATRTGPGTFTKASVHTAISDANNSRWFGLQSRFIGDYIGMAIDTDGVAYIAWTDMRRTVLDGLGRRGQNTVFARVPAP